MYIAIDLGGTKTLVALVDKNGEIHKAMKFPTPQQYSEFLDQLKTVIQEIASGEKIKAACIAIPGTIDREKGYILHLGNLTWPELTPIKADLAAILPCPILVENDANLAALGEAVPIKDLYEKALYVTISTGIGSGYVVDGVLDENTIDSEVGHMLYEHEGKLQEWEDISSGSWIVRTFGKRASEIDEAETWQKIVPNIAVGLVNLTNVYCPDVIIIGGGVGSHLPKFKQYLDQEIERIDPKFNKIPPIIQAQRPEEAVIYGCYELAKQRSV